MRLVFEKFESSLVLRRDAINVLRIEDASLYSRCALSLAQGFPDDALEPAYFFDEEGREIKASKVLFYAGDVLSLDLNDKRIATQMLKTVVERIATEGDSVQALEKINYQIEDIIEEQFLQMSADYRFADVWDASKYLKMLGLCIDDSEDITVYDKVRHFMRAMSDLFPDKVIALVNLPLYLTGEQYGAVCELVASLQLCVLSYERRGAVASRDFENVLFIDADYLER